MILFLKNAFFVLGTGANVTLDGQVMVLFVASMAILMVGRIEILPVGISDAVGTIAQDCQIVVKKTPMVTAREIYATQTLTMTAF